LDSLPNPQVVLWSDHDFGYTNNSTGLDNPSRTDAANAAYRAQFGSSGPNVQGTTLPSKGIYRSFDIGRIQVVCLDMLTFKSKLGSASSSSRTMLGSTQKSWYKQILANPRQPVILVFGDGQIPGPAEDNQDEWRGYAAERSELQSAVSASPATVIYCNGDTHSLAYGHNQFGYDRVWQSAPLNNATKVKAGGEGYLGQYPTNDTEGPTKQMAAVITVVDNGSSISLTYRGFEGSTQRLTDSITVNA
jgi:phosphodiesterase/alkaline phosphatase D-like protein